MSIHDGHRARLRQRFLKHGLDSFDDHTVIELLLFYAVPRGDTNPAAHALMDRFGSLSAVFDAPMDSLMGVPGVGESAATLIRLVPQIARRYGISKARTDDIVEDSHAAGVYLAPLFTAARDELVYLLCLDAKCKVLDCALVCRGGVSSASFSVRQVAETAIACNASSVILAHNHLSGIAVPSQQDLQTTAKLARALKLLDVTLADHLVFADGDWVSMADSGMLDNI